MERCPYLIDVTADWLWLYPSGVFCRRPDGRIRVVAAATLATRCDGGLFHECEGYRTTADEGDHHGA
jgi:hypothetical protein